MTNLNQQNPNNKSHLFPNNNDSTDSFRTGNTNLSVLTFDYPPTAEISAFPEDKSYPSTNINDLNPYTYCHLIAGVGTIDINFGNSPFNLSGLLISASSNNKDAFYTFRVTGLPYGGVWDVIRTDVRFHVRNESNSPRIFPQIILEPGTYQAIQIIIGSTINESYINEIKLI